ncbi:hypothetical protein C8J57DRAFT_1458877 [Mycena rebaudengoi]|nr:hypothetical protein C8J57DRAFT_1458877 [Mycena rebaudengoi]
MVDAAVVGLVGAAATIGATQLTAGAGFTGRHESSHREERMETKRNRVEFMENLKNGDVSREEEEQFLKTLDETNRRHNEYYESIEGYKDFSWLRFLTKLKKRKRVRRAKRRTQKSNESLWALNVSMQSTSKKISSICASAGSPPRSNHIRNWTDDVAYARRERLSGPPKRLSRSASLPTRLSYVRMSQSAVDVVEEPGARVRDEFWEELTRAVQLLPLREPVGRLVRKGLTPDDVFAPPAYAHPAEPKDYPHKLVDMKSTGSQPELPKSLPLRGQPPESPYETLLQCVDPQSSPSLRSSSVRIMAYVWKRVVRVSYRSRWSIPPP